MRKTSIILVTVICANINNTSCQTNEGFVLSKEKIEIKVPILDQLSVRNQLNVVGMQGDNIVLETKNHDLYVYDEVKKDVKKYPKTITLNSKTIREFVHNDLLLQIGYSDLPEQFRNIPIDEIPSDKYEYQEFWIQYKGMNYPVDSFPYHYLDKYISSNFSVDGEKLICNPYTSVSAGYSPETDDRIYVYKLQGIDSGKIKKLTIACERCMNTFEIRDIYYFQKEIPIGKGYDGYYNNIYKAPSRDIEDTILIAHDIELKNITPDGLFILGEKYLYGKSTPVIINVETKKYQFILGRKYPVGHSFYSIKEKKFVFDFGKQLVYIEFPKTYPFDALKNTTFKRTTTSENEAFWNRYLHKPLE